MYKIYNSNIKYTLFYTIYFKCLLLICVKKCIIKWLDPSDIQYYVCVKYCKYGLALFNCQT